MTIPIAGKYITLVDLPVIFAQEKEDMEYMIWNLKEEYEYV